MRYPPLVKKARVDRNIIGNIDIAPTLYELAGIPIPAGVDGRSLVPQLRTDSNAAEGTGDEQAIVAARDRALLLEGWNSRPWTMLRYERYAYLEYKWDRPELYDLLADPYQLTNIAEKPAYAGIVANLKQRLKAQAEPVPAGDDTTYAITYDGWRATPMSEHSGYRAANARGQVAIFDTPNPTSIRRARHPAWPRYGQGTNRHRRSGCRDDRPLRTERQEQCRLHLR